MEKTNKQTKKSPHTRFGMWVGPDTTLHCSRNRSKEDLSRHQQLIGWVAGRTFWHPACVEYNPGFALIVSRLHLWLLKWTSLGCLQTPLCLKSIPCSLSKNPHTCCPLTPSFSTDRKWLCIASSLQDPRWSLYLFPCEKPTLLRQRQQ